MLRRPCHDAPARPRGYGRTGAACRAPGAICSDRGAAMIDPSRTRVFEELGVDYCCGGKQSLSTACDARGLAVDHAVAALESVAGAPSGERDWASAPLSELCDHIVTAHHDHLREELPRLDGLLEKVVRAHGDGRPELSE